MNEETNLEKVEKILDRTEEQELFHQARHILTTVLEHPQEHWEGLIGDLCGRHHRLRLEVISLLNHAEPADPVVQATAVVTTGQDHREKEDLPSTIGPYRILRRLGQGGMGEVFLALQTGAGFEREVALKRLRSNDESESILTRFRFERKILAKLDHPNISRFFHGDSDQNGRPYFVMEYVAGVPIHQYCRENSLSLTERLILFRKVCSAVQYAHQQLVLHRDIKPTNILVTADGEPKLLDFGIAKLLAPGSDPITQRFSESCFTPEYSAPEVLEGALASTASDVYSLGLLLQELAGVNRQVPENPTSQETAYPPLPTRDFLASQTSSQRPQISISRPVRGPRMALWSERRELNEIVSKACAERIEERYGSAFQLGEDLRLLIEGKPISLQSASIPYRVKKFLQRNPGRVAAGIVALVAIFGLSSLRIEKLQADAAKEDMEHLVQNLLEGLDPDYRPQQEVTTDYFLAATEAALLRSLPGSPAARAGLLGKLGSASRKLGYPVSALSAQEHALRIQGEILPPTHPETVINRSNLALTLLELGRYDSALQHLNWVLETNRHRYGGESLEVAQDLSNTAGVHMTRGDLSQAISLYEEARTISSAIRTRRAQATTAAILNGLGNAYRENSEPAKSEPYLLESIAIRRSIGDDSSRGMSKVLLGLGLALRDLGRLEEAEQVIQQSLELRESLYPEPTSPEIAKALLASGSCARILGDLDRAESLLEKALQVFQTQKSSRSLQTAQALTELSILRSRQGRYGLAEELASAALQLLEERFPTQHMRMAALRQILAEASLGIERGMKPRLSESSAIPNATQ
ncbi:MAG: serine/threonine-protein kinase [Deltaproteobacteria bacterium]|nr:serine/threonine-protein kinase [Deltaproteobacteria bacterium]